MPQRAGDCTSLNQRRPIAGLVADPHGTIHRVSAEEMQNSVSAAKRQVVEDCGSLDPPVACRGAFEKVANMLLQDSASRSGPVFVEPAKRPGFSRPLRATGPLKSAAMRMGADA